MGSRVDTFAQTTKVAAVRAWRAARIDGWIFGGGGIDGAREPIGRDHRVDRSRGGVGEGQANLVTIRAEIWGKRVIMGGAIMFANVTFGEIRRLERGQSAHVPEGRNEWH